MNILSARGLDSPAPFETKIDAGRVEALNAQYSTANPSDILRVVLAEFSDRIALVSSFGAESVVLLHLVSEVDPTLPIIFLNTGKLFGETLRYRDNLQMRLGLSDIRAIGPHPDDLKHTDANGDLWTHDTDGCCHIRKVLPLARAVKGFDALITGRKRFQTDARGKMDVIEFDGDGRVKINPLANWGLADLKAYIEKHNLPRHPLVKDGYVSIGCMPCTSRVESGADYRSGRWSGTDKTECGIHQNKDGDGI